MSWCRNVSKHAIDLPRLATVYASPHGLQFTEALPPRKGS